MKKMLMAALLVSLAACTKKESHDNRVDVRGTMNDKTLSASVRAEKVAEAGEELMANPAAFMYADQLFDMALELDPSNKRAQMYKAINSPFMSLKGILARVKPLISKYPNGEKSYTDAVASMQNDLPPRVFQFLMDGAQDIKDEKGIQAFIEQWQRGYGRIRTFFKSNKDVKLNVVIPATLAFRTLDNPKACDARMISEYEFEYTDCPGIKKSVVEINRADSEALQQVFALYEIGLILYNAYDLSGAIDVARESKDKDYTNSQVYQLLAKNSDFAKVRNKAALSSIVEMGLDGLAAVRYVLQNQAELCPARPNDGAIGLPKGTQPDEYGYAEGYMSGSEVPRRPGTAFEDGFCMKQENGQGTPVEEVLAAVEKVLRGGTLKMKYFNRKTLEQEVTVSKPTALLHTPVMDLKSLAPRFDKCGEKVVGVSDQTLGGYLPGSDANKVLSASSVCE